MSAQDWSKLTVPLLKAELTTRGLSTTGLKKDLVARLSTADAANAAPASASHAAPSEQIPTEGDGHVGGDAGEQNVDEQDMTEEPVPEGATNERTEQAPVAPTPIPSDATKVAPAATSRKRARESSREEGDGGGGSEGEEDERRVGFRPTSPPSTSEALALPSAEVDKAAPTVDSSLSSPPQPPPISTAPTSEPPLSATKLSPKPATTTFDSSTSVQPSSPKLEVSPAPTDEAVVESSASPPKVLSAQSSSSPPESSSIYVTNLVRPFTVPQLKELLEEYGNFSMFWIDAIKSHCYVTFESTTSASTAFKALSGTAWPPQTGKLLKIHYVPSDKVADLIKEEEAVSGSGARGAPRVRLDLSVQWRASSDDSGGGEWTYTLEGGRRESSLGMGILKEERLAPVRPTPLVPTGPRNPQLANRPPSAPQHQEDSRGPRFAPLPRGPTETELRELELKMKLERKPLGGPEKYFKKTKTAPSIFYQESSRTRPTPPS